MPVNVFEVPSPHDPRFTSLFGLLAYLHSNTQVLDVLVTSCPDFSWENLQVLLKFEPQRPNWPKPTCILQMSGYVLDPVECYISIPRSGWCALGRGSGFPHILDIREELTTLSKYWGCPADKFPKHRLIK